MTVNQNKLNTHFPLQVFATKYLSQQQYSLQVQYNVSAIKLREKTAEAPFLHQLVIDDKPDRKDGPVKYLVLGIPFH